jgi:hypothetical protein
MMTAYTPEKENNYLLRIIHMILSKMTVLYTNLKNIQMYK